MSETKAVYLTTKELGQLGVVLEILTIEQLVHLAQSIARLERDGFGSVKILVARGHPHTLEVTISEKMQRGEP